MAYTKMKVDNFFATDSTRKIAAECGICVKDVSANEVNAYGGSRGILTFVRDYATYIIEEIEYKRRDIPEDMVFSLVISAPEDQRADWQKAIYSSLLLCPFCGEKESIIRRALEDEDGKETEIRYGCGTCGALGGPGNDDEEAARIWNTRYTAKGENHDI